MRLTVLLCCGIAVAGCLFDPGIPAGAPLACAADADCPADAVCILGRCAPVEALRTPPPAVVDVTISPALVGRAGRVEVSFAVEGALLAAPVVEGDVGRPVRLEDAGPSDGRHHFVYVVDGSEAPGDAPLTVTLVDALGRATSTGLGSFTLDLQAPTFADATVARARVGLGGAIDVAAVLDAAATVEGRVACADDVSVPLAITLNGLRVRGAATVDARFPEGARCDVVLRARDDAGNDSGDVVVGVVVVDLGAPTVTLQAPPTTVRPRELVRFVMVSDELAIAPTLTVTTTGVDVIPPDVIPPDVATGTAFGWSWVVPDPGVDADVTVTPGAVVDEAGNATVLPSWTVRIDRTAPDLIVEEPLPRQVRAGDVIAARFSFSEPVTVGAVELIRFDEVIFADVTGSGGGGGAGSFTIAVPADSARGEGRYDAVVTAVDGAGNESRVSLGSVVVDARPPALLDATFTPAEARLGSTVTLQLTFSEPLAVDDTGALPGLVSNTPLTFVGQSGTTFTWALVVTSTTPTPVEVTGLAMRDLAGNDAVVGVSPVARLVVDNRAPVLTGVAPVAARVQRRDGNAIVVEGHVDDDGAIASVSASFGDRAVACIVAADGGLRCELPITDDDGDGVQAVGVTAIDAAGNTTSVAVLVTLDGEGPRALSTTFGQDAVRPGGAVQLSLLADEALAEVELGLSTGTTIVRPGTSTLGLPLRAPASGALTLSSARLVDDLGNARTVTFSPPLRVDVDGLGPTIVGATLSTNARLPAAARAGDTVVVEADVELPVLEAPSFRFGATPMTITFDDGAGHFQATHVVTSADIEGAIVVGVTAADALGNIAFARLEPPIVVDLTPPTLIPDTARLAIQAPPNAPVVAPTAVGRGARATFSWVVSEAPIGTPAFRLAAAGVVVPTSQSGVGTSFNARFDSVAFASGRHTLLVEQEDAVGNVGTLELGVFDVDLDAPAPLDAAERAALVHVRAPHGSVDVAAPFHRIEGRQTLPGRAGQTLSVALDDGDLIRLASGPLGGAVTLPLDRDLDRVFLQVYDEAGNVAPVRGLTPRTELIAGLNGRVVGQDGSNPHRLELRRQFTGVVDDPSAEEQNGLAVALRDSVRLTAASEGRWQDSGPRPPPSPRAGVASTTHRGTVMLFGGCSAEGPVDEAWAFDGRSWVPLVGEDGRSPPARCGGALASDGERVFLFGGEGPTGLLNDLWAWDDRNWKRIEGASVPSPRRGMAFGIDDTGEFVIYGGASARGVDGEHWRSSSRGDDWRLVGVGPAATSAAAAMSRDTLLVIGGLDDRGEVRGDTLRITADLIDVESLPEPRTGACALPLGDATLVIGGHDGRTPLTDVVVIGADPAGLPVPPLPLPFVDGACGAFSGTPLFFGGLEDGTLSDVTRMLFADWDVVGLTDLPSARSHGAATTIEDLMLMFGGDVDGVASSEVWELREGWKLIGTMPAVARAGVACLDPGQCLIVGGEDRRGRRTTALRWDRERGAAELAVDGFTPRTNPAVAMDGPRGQVVVFGGVTATGNSLETCVVDDVNKEPLHFDCRVLPGPTSSVGAVMTPTPDGPVLWAAGTLWRRDRDEWIELTAEVTPPVRQFPVLAVSKGRVWLHGGQVGSTLLDDLWSLDGKSWRQHDPADPFGAGAPPPRAGHVGFFDERLNRLVVFGGDQRPTPVADTWDFLPGDQERAGLVIDVDLAAASGFDHLDVVVQADSPHIVVNPDTDVTPGPTASLPLDGETGRFRVAVVPAEPGQPLDVDAVDLRLVRP